MLSNEIENRKERNTIHNITNFTFFKQATARQVDLKFLRHPHEYHIASTNYTYSFPIQISVFKYFA